MCDIYVEQILKPNMFISHKKGRQPILEMVNSEDENQGDSEFEDENKGPLVDDSDIC